MSLLTLLFLVSYIASIPSKLYSLIMEGRESEGVYAAVRLPPRIERT